MRIIEALIMTLSAKSTTLKEEVLNPTKLPKIHSSNFFLAIFPNKTVTKLSFHHENSTFQKQFVTPVRL